jgi:hypothetical protein
MAGQQPSDQEIRHAAITHTTPRSQQGGLWPSDPPFAADGSKAGCCALWSTQVMICWRPNAASACKAWMICRAMPPSAQRRTWSGWRCVTGSNGACAPYRLISAPPLSFRMCRDIPMKKWPRCWACHWERSSRGSTAGASACALIYSIMDS